MKWVIAIIIIAIIIIVFFVYKIIRHLLIKGNSAQTETNIAASTFLKKGGTVNECSYSIWFIIDNWTNGEKILFNKKSRNEIDTQGMTSVETYDYDTGTTGSTSWYYDIPVSITRELNFEVSFDDYVNNMNIFLPELNNNYKKSNDCKITQELLEGTTGLSGTIGSSEDDCRNKCSGYNDEYNTCNSFSYETYQKPISTDPIEFIFKDGEFEGNQGYNGIMGYGDSTETLTKCNLYSSAPVMPKNCFSGMTGKTNPYSVYDWEDFVYSNNITSYAKENCSLPIPIQKWTSLIITIKNLSMDIYINGKLSKQCSLTREIDISNDSSANFTITPFGYGFNGSTMNFTYWNKCLTTSEISNLSKKVS